jgi:hypothetical protein
MIQLSTCSCNPARKKMVLVLKTILMNMITTILMRRRHQVFFVIFKNYSFYKNYYCHIAVKKDFPLDLKIKRENKRTEDDISVVASEVKEERSQPSFLQSDDDVIALPAPKPKPRTNEMNAWDEVAPKFS